MCVLYNNYVNLSINNNILLSTKEKHEYIDILIKNNRIANVCKKFYFKIKKNLINKLKPINECELYSLDTYDKNNNNIYIYSNNKKWWFSINTMNTIISNYLASICLETLQNISKPICNPYTGEKLTYSQLYSVYFQLKKYNNVSNLFSLLQMCDFSYKQFVSSSLSYIIMHNHKKNIIHLNDEDLVTYFYNLIAESNYEHISYENMINNMNIIKEDLISLIKCSCYKDFEEYLQLVRIFITKYPFIMRKIVKPDLQNNEGNYLVRKIFHLN